jgi:hypothetical protein
VDIEINLCRWCRGHATRRSNAAIRDSLPLAVGAALARITESATLIREIETVTPKWSGSDTAIGAAMLNEALAHQIKARYCLLEFMAEHQKIEEDAEEDFQANTQEVAGEALPPSPCSGSGERP